MSAISWTRGGNDAAPAEEPVLAPTPVVVRRHAGVAALIGVAASAVSIAYLWRAAQTAGALDWALCGVMGLVAAVYLAALVDARTPLLVADDLGVRIRLGDEWRGLPWEAIGQVVVHPRRGLLRDGRLVFAPRSLARALDGVHGRARRHVALNQQMYGAPLAVPLGFTTRVSGPQSHADLRTQVTALAQGRADVVEIDPRTLEVVEPGRRDAAVPGMHGGGDLPHEDAPPTETAHGDTAEGDTADGATDRGRPAPGPSDQHRSSRDFSAQDFSAQDPSAPAREAARAEVPGVRAGGGPSASLRDGRRRILGGIGTVVSRVGKGRVRDLDAPAASSAGAASGQAGGPGTGVPAVDAPARTPSTPALLRQTRPGARAEATLATAGTAALDLSDSADGRRFGLPEGRELRRPGSVDLVVEPMVLDDRIRPISTMGDPVAPIVIDDFAVEPAYDPVIGPELAAARTRLGLSVDELAERTRIRPHVIESIEVDDFGPCGGDFYARGHLRTLARILGKDAGPILEVFEERYASAPVNARRVFEAELATGMTGSMRSTTGGPSWSLLVGVVLVLVLVWGVVRSFSTEPVELVEIPAPATAPVDPAGIGPAGSPVTSGRGPAGLTEPVPVRLRASRSDTVLVVRDGQGTVVFSGELLLGERRTLRVEPPVTVRAADGGAVEVRVAGRDLGFLGAAGEPARRTFERPAQTDQARTRQAPRR